MISKLLSNLTDSVKNDPWMCKKGGTLYVFGNNGTEKIFRLMHWKGCWTVKNVLKSEKGDSALTIFSSNVRLKKLHFGV